ncbi:MAG: FKBP-type peptidyl-prolyl cis-trans isomerase [Bacteroidetes bacterium]|nr:MAG: FKBP-type peptidyl-prolyl cis-trans isomerase [Bacteroidota bacterium]
MKRLMLITACIGFVLSVNAQNLKTANDSLSYAVGVIWGQNMIQQGMNDVNVDQVAAAIKALMEKKETAFDIKTANDIVKNYIMAKKEAAKTKNLEEGREFLAENAKRPEVKVTESGLQYEVLKQGDGPIPTASDKVKVHYHGTLIDGTVFDSSVERGEPIVFPVTGVIKGWVEALQMMPVGSKWKLYIPPNLAYGERGAGGTIGPNAVLIFEVELLGIE